MDASGHHAENTAKWEEAQRDNQSKAAMIQMRFVSSELHVDNQPK